MAREIKFTVTLTLADDDPRDQAALVQQVDDAVSDGVDQWYAVAVEPVVPDQPAGMRKFVAEPNYVEQVFLELERQTPNAPEDWDDESVQEVANYLDANGWATEYLGELDTIYAMYDLTKWTRGNNS